jgi:agmatinase
MPELAVEETMFGLGASDAPRAVVLGVPLDLSAGCRAGGGDGPAAVRALSRALEAYSPELRRDLRDTRFADLGDLDLPDDLEAAVERIDAAVSDQLDSGRIPILVGGEHTVSTGAVRSALARHDRLVLLHVDAHTDLRSEYEGETLSRATWIRYSGLPLDRVVQLGVRSQPGDLTVRPAHLSSTLEAPRALLEDRPVYLTIDIDVLDPSAAPGVLCPEPGGASFRELLALVHSLAGLRLVAIDIVEVAPDTDPAGLTALAAAKLLRELLLIVA